MAAKQLGFSQRDYEYYPTQFSQHVFPLTCYYNWHCGHKTTGRTLNLPYNVPSVAIKPRTPAPRGKSTNHLAHPAAFVFQFTHPLKGGHYPFVAYSCPFKFQHQLMHSVIMERVTIFNHSVYKEEIMY